VYNQADFIERTILSVLSQNYPNLEYIIIDGGSNDGTVEIIKKYAAELAYWVSEPDNGIYYALQKGFEKSSGEIMGWINADDLLHCRSLFTLADIFSINNTVKWITGIPTTIDKADRIVDVLSVRKWSKYNYLLKDFHVIQQESTYWKRELWSKAGNHICLEYKYAGDLELWARFFSYEKLYSVTVPIGGFRIRQGEQLSSRYLDEYLQESHRILNLMPKTGSDELILKKINFYNKYIFLLKSDSLKSKYLKLFDYPRLIQYSREKQKFLMT
jgi:glycosyltransferase involved in cell wall biosynthesis